MTAELNGGGRSTPRNFNIELEGCDISTLKTVQATFTGAPSSFSTGALAINGTAKNAAIVITDSGSTQIKLGDKSAEQTLTAGGNLLRFSAYLQGDAANTAVPGNYQATVRFKLDYY